MGFENEPVDNRLFKCGLLKQQLKQASLDTRSMSNSLTRQITWSIWIQSEAICSCWVLTISLLSVWTCTPRKGGIFNLTPCGITKSSIINPWSVIISSLYCSRHRNPDCSTSCICQRYSLCIVMTQILKVHLD